MSEALLDRLRKATKGSRELDWTVCSALGMFRSGTLLRWPDEFVSYSSPPDVSTSIDAALALVERVLPGWVVRLDQYPDKWDVNICQWRKGHGLYGDDFDAEAKTAPLAILIALLSAKEPAT